MLDLLPSNLREPLDGNAALKTLGQPVTLAEIHRVQVMLIVEASLDQLLDAKDGRWVQAFQVREYVLAHSSMERWDRLFREDFAERFVACCQHRQASPATSSVPHLMKPHSRSSCASFFFPKINTSFALVAPTVEHRWEVSRHTSQETNTYCGCGMSR